MSKVHYIYKITFLKGSLEGHYYLGKKTSNIPRYAEGGNILEFVKNNPMFDSYSGSGTVPINYFSKYGKILGKTFMKEIIMFSENVMDNCKNEEKTISDKYKTDPLCVNITKGGNVNPAILGYRYNRKHSEAAKLKDSICHKKLWQNPEYCVKTIEGMRKFYETHESPNIGRKLSQEQKEVLHNINIGKTNIKNTSKNNGMYHKIPANARSVLQYDKEGNFIAEWKSAAEAKRILGIDNITAVCSGKRKYSGGYIWKYGESNYSSNTKEVCLYSLDGKLINTYKSAWEAAKLLNLDSSSIFKVCLGKGKTCGGYKWKFTNENN